MLSVELRLDKQDFRSNEAYKLLRTNLEFSGDENRVIALTSCIPNEGKSTVSIRLAAALADAGKQVLFIDADMRKSTLSRQFRVGKFIKGLSHFLSGQSPIEEVLCETDKKNLYTIFAGPVPPNPAELVSSARFQKLLEKARENYDAVIIDTPPLGSVVDAAIMASMCDASIMVIAASETSYRFAQDVKNQLDNAGSKVLGVVLNKVDMKQNKYYGRYYGQYSNRD